MKNLTVSVLIISLKRVFSVMCVCMNSFNIRNHITYILHYILYVLYIFSNISILCRETYN